jgi:hypothetical protein
MFSTQYRTLFPDTQRDDAPVPVFAIFNDRVPECIWSVAHVKTAPLPASAENNDGFPLSNPPLGSRLVVCATTQTVIRPASVSAHNDRVRQFMEHLLKCNVKDENG